MEVKIYSSLREAIKAAAPGEEVKSRHAVSGGDINRAYCYRLTDGRIFVKTNGEKDSGFFKAEAEGLAAISSTLAVSVPQVLAVGDDPEEGGFLVMEYIEAAAGRIPDFWEDFGESLANMHRAETSRFVSNGKYGFCQDNYIGSRAQDNMPQDSWAEFLRNKRLSPRFEEAMPYFNSERRRRVAYLLDHIDKWIDEPEHPSLIHGDLWSGNFIVGSDGKAWLIDPAVYVGDADADIAMTELFGGFSGRFYRAYRSVLPERTGYEERRDIYNLYHLLNHLISFGGEYLSHVEGILRRYAG